jgi:choline dehydrogenase-like flavoprotein
MTIYYAAITGPNTGLVRNFPFSPAPLVRYSLGVEHMRILSTALRYLCRLLFAAGAIELYPSIAGMPVLRSEADLATIPSELPREGTSLTTVHLFSSCPMGQTVDFSAVDSFGRVHGYKNLFVNDASLLCTAPGVNPQGTIMALARRNAQHFSKDL